MRRALKYFLFISATINYVFATVLIDPATQGGFESGSSFAANGWTEVNGAQTNKWWSKTPGNPATPFAGSNCAYVSDHATGNTYNYNTSNTSVVHFYRDITIPAGEPYLTLSFYYKGQGESSYDYIRVYNVSTGVTPVAGTQIGSGQIGGDYNQVGSWTLVTQTFCATPGTTIRLVFSWINDGSVGTQPPGAIDNISLQSTSSAPPCNLGTGVTNVASLPYASGAGTTCGAVNDLTSGNTMVCGSSSYLGGEDRVWIFTPLTSGTITINLTSSGTYTGLMLYDGCPLLGSCTPGGIAVCCVASATGSTGDKTLLFCAKANKTYYLILDSWPAPTCNPYSNLTISAPTGSCVTNTDCTQGTTVCNSSPFTGNASGYGCIQELNAGNQGCLSSGENQSSWYLFSPATSGNLGLTISPNPGIDYDFAIWGPYPPGSNSGTICPPAVPPIRCSYASGGATFGQTGSYDTGIGHSVYSVPQFAPPVPAYTDGIGNTLNGWVPGIQATAGQVYILLIDNFTANTTPFNLTWSLSGGATLSCVPLAVEMLSFSGVNMGSKNRLEWVTASENEMNYFEIQRSADAENFVSIGRMKAMNSKNIEFTYVFNDDSPEEGINYYRLKQVDLNGKLEYSEVISIQMGNNERISVKNIYPNPTNGQLNVDIYSETETVLKLTLTDLLGKTIYEKKIETTKGLNVISISEERVPKGMFFVNITSESEGLSHTRRVIRN